MSVTSNLEIKVENSVQLGHSNDNCLVDFKPKVSYYESPTEQGPCLGSPFTPPQQKTKSGTDLKALPLKNQSFES